MIYIKHYENVNMAKVMQAVDSNTMKILNFLHFETFTLK